jgi:hypothetical protein
MTGASPGPLLIWLGAGFSPVVMGLIGALAGIFVYGLVAYKLT